MHVGLDHVALHSRGHGCRAFGVAPGGMCVDEMKSNAETVRLNDGSNVNIVSHRNLDSFGGGYQLAEVLAGNGVRSALLPSRETAGHRPIACDVRIAVLGQHLRLLRKSVSDLQSLLEQHRANGAFQDGDLARADTGERAVIGADGRADTSPRSDQSQVGLCFPTQSKHDSTPLPNAIFFGTILGHFR
jgi:hypothetical protein